MAEVDYVGEGPTDAEVARALIRAAGGSPGTDYVTPRRGRGKDNLDQRLAGFRAGAEHGRPILVLRDLDSDAPCAGELVSRLMTSPHPLFCLRVAVRAVEVWLMADRKAFAREFGVGENAVPPNEQLESLVDPKARLIELARQSRKHDIRQGVPPSSRSGVRVGPEYAAWLSDFARDQWDPRRAVAAGGVPSLERALLRLMDVVTSVGRQ